MTKSWNSEDELRARLTFLSNRDAWELTDILQMAHRRVKSKFGTEVEERLYPNYEDQKKFKLSFSNLLEFKEAQIYDKLIDEEDYSVDNENGEITFTESYASDKLSESSRYRLVVRYIPVIFKDLELYFAMEEILSLNMVQTNDEQQTNRFEQVRNAIRDIVKDVNRSMPLPDRESGKTLMANRRRSHIHR